jgi:hypothetical protein
MKFVRPASIYLSIASSSYFISGRSRLIILKNLDLSIVMMCTVLTVVAFTFRISSTKNDSELITHPRLHLSIVYSNPLSIFVDISTVPAKMRNMHMDKSPGMKSSFSFSSTSYFIENAIKCRV